MIHCRFGGSIQVRGLFPGAGKEGGPGRNHAVRRFIALIRQAALAGLAGKERLVADFDAAGPSGHGPA